MRFAGTRIEQFMGADKPDYGRMAQNAGTIRSDESNKYNDISAQVGVSGLNANAEVEAAKEMAAGQAAMAAGQAQGSMWKSIGGIGSSLIGAFGGGGGGSFEYNTTPFGAGGGNVGGYGTFGPNYGFKL